jgi:hypothetical protein
MASSSIDYKSRSTGTRTSLNAGSPNSVTGSDAKSVPEPLLDVHHVLAHHGSGHLEPVSDADETARFEHLQELLDTGELIHGEAYALPSGVPAQQGDSPS